MSNAIRYGLAREGESPQDFALLAMGGGGGVHAGIQAEDLGIRTIIVPATAPYLSALGDLQADLKVSQVRTFLARAEGLDLDALNRHFQEMEARARERLGRALDSTEAYTDLSVDMRYVGEVHEVTVDLPTRTRRVTALNLQTAIARFHEIHQQRFAHHNRQQPVEVLALRLDLIGRTDKPALVRHPLGPEDPGPARSAQRRAFF